jgi:hypothetical protein
MVVRSEPLVGVSHTVDWRAAEKRATSISPFYCTRDTRYTDSEKLVGSNLCLECRRGAVALSVQYQNTFYSTKYT